jgi:hypothetical protein
MAKQTINIGAAPNDGTGTPLRTSFDYCNQNFTELYTATGPSGNNIVVPGSATITGDLTVRTSGLSVSSSGVGIGSATPTSGTLSLVSRFLLFGDSQTKLGDSGLVNGAAADGNTQLQYFGGKSLFFNEGVATRMTLNSTGLGVGVTPAAGDGSGVFKAAGTGSFTANSRVGLDVRELVSGNSAGILLGAMTTENTGVIGARTGSGNIAFQTYNGSAWGERMRIDYLGNVGIGVTPSAWGSNSKALQVGGGTASVSSTGAGSTASRFAHGAYFDNTNWLYQYTGVGPALYQVTGANAGSTHAWYTSAGGTAGNTITDFATAKMTLDASGNLLVGKTTSLFSTVGIEASQTGFFSLTNSASTNAATNLSVYSTGAAAFRFYVGLAGTVFATNTTISAISDARFKENVQDIDVGLGAILALKPRKFDWKAGKGKDIKGDRGFIAQEFEQVFPNLVDEWKDNAPEGEAPYKSVRQDLIPVLVKAIQELTARVEALEA